MNAIDILHQTLVEDFGFRGAEGQLKFNLKDYEIIVEQNNVVGNILEEWLDKWMSSKGITHIHNNRQSAPDFWLNPDDPHKDWLEIKTFTGSPNFDIAAFRSFVSLVIDEPWKLHSNYLLIKYTMNDGIVVIEDFWIKSLWEICCSSNQWPIKVQCKRGTIFNIRPSTWYSETSEYPSFRRLEDFLAALEETIYQYHDTRTTIAEHWLERLRNSYCRHYNTTLTIPRWNDIKQDYIKN